MWIRTILLLVFIKTSEETCELSTKTYTKYALQRDVNRYVLCTGIRPDNDLHTNIMSVMNNSFVPYLDVINSTVPEITQNIFSSMNITQLKIDAGVQIIQEQAFENCNISIIILENNQIKKLKGRSFNSSVVSFLSLKNNSLNEITVKNFVGLVNLRKLNLQNNQILDIQPYSFKDLQSLEELDLSFNRLDNLPSNIFRTIKYVQMIYLNNNRFKEINHELFAENMILQFLHLQNNYLSIIDATLFPSSILYMNLEKNGLSVFNVSNLTNLNRVILNSNKLTKTKDCLLNLPALSFLHLNHNFLGSSSWNDTLDHLKNLTVIEFDDNQLQNFDLRIVRNLKSLYGISLVNNNITYLDFSDTIMNIKHLNLSFNLLTDVRNLSNIKGLEKLELSYNNFDKINFEMFKELTALRNLWLQHNSIKLLDRGCFADLKGLIELNLSYNKISILSLGILNGMYGLSALDLSYNNLTSLDEDIFHTTRSLRFLNVAYNNLSNVNMKKILYHTMWLREINLLGNNWTCKSLMNIIRDNRAIVLTGGNSYNVSNVYGIPCNETKDVKKDFDTIQYYQDILKLINSTESVSKELSYKLSVSNTVLIMFLILLLGKLVYDKYSPRIVAAKQFVYQKAESEQEIQLV